MSHQFVMQLILHMFHTLVTPYVFLDQYLNPNLYTIPNMQNVRFFCQGITTFAFSIYLHCITVLSRLNNNAC